MWFFSSSAAEHFLQLTREKENLWKDQKLQKKKLKRSHVHTMNAFLSRKLKALGYPKDVTSMEGKHVSDIVCFLEDRIVRHYEVKERDSLRNEKEFANAFESYLRDLDCPMRILKSKDVNVNHNG